MKRPRSKYGITRREYDEHRSLYVPHNPNSAKLTPDQVRMIRASIESSTVIARALGVYESTIRAVRTYKTWKHIR